MDATIQSDQARYRVKPTTPDSTLPPVALYIETGSASFADWLTPAQAIDIGHALIVRGEAAANASEGSVLDGADELLGAADRLDAALGEGRR